MISLRRYTGHTHVVSRTTPNARFSPQSLRLCFDYTAETFMIETSAFETLTSVDEAKSAVKINSRMCLSFYSLISELECCLGNNFRPQLIETYDLRIISNIVYDSTPTTFASIGIPIDAKHTSRLTRESDSFDRSLRNRAFNCFTILKDRFNLNY